MAVNIPKESPEPGAEYPLLQHETHENVVNDTQIHLAEADAEKAAAEAAAEEPPLVDPADEAAQQAANANVQQR